MQTAEGLVRPVVENENNTTAFVYDYFLRDHLGSVRVIITEANATDECVMCDVNLHAASGRKVTFNYL